MSGRVGRPKWLDTRFRQSKRNVVVVGPRSAVYARSLALPRAHSSGANAPDTRTLRYKLDPANRLPEHSQLCAVNDIPDTLSQLGDLD